MKSLLGIVAASLIALASSQGAYAQLVPKGGPAGEGGADQKNLPSTRTRAEIQKECVEALKANRTPSGECSAEPAATGGSKPTRAQVQAECARALKENRTPSGECSPEPQMKK